MSVVAPAVSPRKRPSALQPVSTIAASSSSSSAVMSSAGAPVPPLHGNAPHALHTSANVNANNEDDSPPSRSSSNDNSPLHSPLSSRSPPVAHPQRSAYSFDLNAGSYTTFYSDNKIVATNMSEHTLKQVEVAHRPALWNAVNLPTSMVTAVAANAQSAEGNGEVARVNSVTPPRQQGSLSKLDLNESPNGGADSNAGASYPTRPTKKQLVPPLAAGWLWMAKNSGKWARYWCEYADCVFTYRVDAALRKPTGILQVSYCEAERRPAGIKVHDLAANESKDPLDGLTTAMSALSVNSSNGSSAHPGGDSKMEELYWSYVSQPLPTATQTQNTGLSRPPSVGTAGSTTTAAAQNPVPAKPASPSNSAMASFRLWSPGRVHLFRAEPGSSAAAEIVDAVRKQLSELMAVSVWQEKHIAAHIVTPLLHDQFVVQLYRHHMLLRALSKSGIQEDELPITSTRKDKSGVLCMETPYDVTRWRDYYFVLFEGILFYYKVSWVQL